MLQVQQFMPDAIKRGWVIEDNGHYRPSTKGITACDSIVQYDDVAWQIWENATEDQQGAAIMAILIRAIKSEPAWLRFIRQFTG